MTDGLEKPMPGEYRTTLPYLAVQRLDRDAVLPARSHPWDAGLDLYSLHQAHVIPDCVTRVRTGIAVGIPPGYYGRIEPRSGLAAKHGVQVLGGVIDAGYTGEIVVLLGAVNEAGLSLPEHTRIAQLVILPCETPEIVEVESLNDTERGGGGFGSTGA